MAEDKTDAGSNTGYMLYYRRPIQSRNKRLWLVYISTENMWALSSSPYFPKSVDLGLRWASRMEGVIILNMVAGFPFGSDQMFASIERCNATLSRTTEQKANNHLAVYTD